jgi:hypothetical protein
MMRKKLSLETADDPISEHLEDLRKAWREGIASGHAGKVDFELREAAMLERAERNQKA